MYKKVPIENIDFENERIGKAYQSGTKSDLSELNSKEVASLLKAKIISRSKPKGKKVKDGKNNS